MGMFNKRKQFIFAGTSVLIGISVAIGILFLGEIAVRKGTNIIFLGNSSNLFTAKMFGTSRGNTPNIRALSFHEFVYTDNNGFRIPGPDYQYQITQNNKVLILGDSVAFGVGVAEKKTVVGQIRASKPEWAIFNAAVIGHSLDDYLNVVRSLLDKGNRYKFVILFMCLNDVSSDSAILLDSPSVPRTFSIVERIRNLTFAVAVNDWLRENSKLYLYVKGVVTDPSARYFYADYIHYQNEKVDQKLSVVVDLAAELRRVGIPLVVVISPYEYQLRARDGRDQKTHMENDPMLPQRMISAFLSEKGVKTHDSTEFFQFQEAKVSSDYFLPFDPAHFSETGHTVMYKFIVKLLHTEKLL